MTSPDSTLAGLQRWMQQAILRGECDVEDAAHLLLPSRTLPPAERLEIYRGMYPLRMEDALRADYPALAHLVGDDAFRRLVATYVVAHPSRSYTLNRLGDSFPEFVARTRRLRSAGFCAELARLEHAIALVFDAPESPPLDGAAVALLGEKVADVRLRPIEAFRLLEMSYPVDAYWQSVRDEDHEHPEPRRKKTWLAVFRRKYVVRRLPLTREQHALLSAITSGATVGDGVAELLRTARRRVAPEELFSWFRDWVAAELFRALS
jgi:hypothetical protein